MKKAISLLLSIIMIATVFPFILHASAESSTNEYPILEGVTMYAMGDSYFGGSSLGKDVTWVNKLGNKYKMDYINYGIGGSTMSDYVTTNSPMVTRIRSIRRTPADIILLEGGRNDLNKEVPLGELDSRDTKTFHGAINFMLDYLRERYPEAFIITITPWKYSSKKSNGYSNITYADAMRSVVEARKDPHIVCLYAADPEITGVDMDKPQFRMQYCIKPTDVSHLNDEGMNMVLPYMEKFIADAYSAFLEWKNPPETTLEETTLSETTAEATTAEETVDCGMPDNTVTDPVAEKGCGGIVALSALTIIICGACLVIFKKK